MRTALIVAALTAALAGCGVQSTDGARTVAGENVPYDLLDAAQPPSTTTLPELASAIISVWLVADDSVVSVNRQVQSPPSVDRAVEALLAGPSSDESSFGLRSALSGESVDGVDVVHGVATIQLTDSFSAATPRNQVLALAQLVFTVTEHDDVEVVTFALEGQAVDVPRGDGSISQGPVTRGDYAALVA